MTHLDEGAPDWGTRLAHEPLLGLVAQAIAVLAMLIIVSVLWLTARSLWEDRVARRRELFWHELGQQLAQVIGDREAEARWLDRARRHPADVLRYSLNEYLIRTSGEYREGLARLYRALGLLDQDLALLHSRRWAVRMRALRRLAGVVTSEHRAAIAALASEGGEVRLLVAQIIGRIGTASDVLPLLASWTVSSRLSEYPVHVMISGLAPEALRELLSHWDELASAAMQRILLDAAAKAVPGACLDLLPRAASHASLEVRIAAAHACGVMTSPQAFALLLTLAGDAAWEVRAQAVKALAAYRAPASVALLLGALCDKSFWVRQNAAAALGRHGDLGKQRLREVMASASDRYARDAAEQVLMDLGLATSGAAS